MKAIRHGVVAVIVRERRFLVIRRSALVVAPGKLCFPGGGIEANETEPAAIHRELQEELNCQVIPVRCIWRNQTAWGVDLAWWLTALAPNQIPQANPAEVESWDWYSPTELQNHQDLLESNRNFLQLLGEKQIDLPWE